MTHYQCTEILLLFGNSNLTTHARKSVSVIGEEVPVYASREEQRQNYSTCDQMSAIGRCMCLHIYTKLCCLCMQHAWYMSVLNLCMCMFAVHVHVIYQCIIW